MDSGFPKDTHAEVNELINTDVWGLGGAVYQGLSDTHWRNRAQSLMQREGLVVVSEFFGHPRLASVI